MGAGHCTQPALRILQHVCAERLIGPAGDDGSAYDVETAILHIHFQHPFFQLPGHQQITIHPQEGHLVQHPGGFGAGGQVSRDIQSVSIALDQCFIQLSVTVHIGAALRQHHNIRLFVKQGYGGFCQVLRNQQFLCGKADVFLCQLVETDTGIQGDHPLVRVVESVLLDTEVEKPIQYGCVFQPDAAIGIGLCRAVDCDRS